MRKNISTNTPSEKRVGYSRAVVVNDTIYVSGTTSMDEEGLTIGKNIFEQTKYIFQKIGQALQQGGFTLNDVIVVRAYITNMNQLADFDRAFKEIFHDIHPTCTLLGIQSLVKSDLLIEIECIGRRSI